eukprot:9316167-Pyramimonas_sp.AAC.1
MTLRCHGERTDPASDRHREDLVAQLASTTFELTHPVATETRVAAVGAARNLIIGCAPIAEDYGKNKRGRLLTPGKCRFAQPRQLPDKRGQAPPAAPAPAEGAPAPAAAAPAAAPDDL